MIVKMNYAPTFWVVPLSLINLAECFILHSKSEKIFTFQNGNFIELESSCILISFIVFLYLIKMRITFWVIYLPFLKLMLKSKLRFKSLVDFVFFRFGQIAIFIQIVNIVDCKQMMRSFDFPYWMIFHRIGQTYQILLQNEHLMV